MYSCRFLLHLRILISRFAYFYVKFYIICIGDVKGFVKHPHTPFSPLSLFMSLPLKPWPVSSIKATHLVRKVNPYIYIKYKGAFAQTANDQKEIFSSPHPELL